jgi:hypothetical protein
LPTLADGKTLDKDGDANLRSSYHAAQAAAIAQLTGDGRAGIGKVVDVGCSSGLSTRALVSAFPAAEQVTVGAGFVFCVFYSSRVRVYCERVRIPQQ